MLTAISYYSYSYRNLLHITQTFGHCQASTHPPHTTSESDRLLVTSIASGHHGYMQLPTRLKVSCLLPSNLTLFGSDLIKQVTTLGRSLCTH